MNRRTFMRKLMSYLKNISSTERQNVENFYNEMFDEQGIGLDDEVPESFGNPRKIAMEILAEDIEIEEERNERSGDKKGSFWKKMALVIKKLSLVLLGILSLPFFPIFPFLVPIFAIAGVFFAVWIVFSVIGLIISLITLPFSIIFKPELIITWGGRLLLFIILLYVFGWLIKWLYRMLVKDISKNPGKYTKKYARVHYQSNDDEDYEIYEEEDMDNSNLNIDSFFEDIDEIEIDFSALSAKFEVSDDKTVRVKSRNLKRTKLYCEKSQNKLKIYNKGLVGHLDDKGIIIDGDFIKDSSLTIYVPENVSIRGEISASSVKMKDLELKDFKLEIDAGNATLKNLEVKNFEVDVNAGNIKGDVEYQDMFELDVQAGNATLDVDKLYGEIEYEYNVEMGSLRIFGESFAGFDKNGRKNRASDVNMKINCEAGKVTIN